MMKFFVETHVLSDDHQKRMQQLIDSQAHHLWFVGFQCFLFLSYYFLKFTYSFFQDIYNTRLKERYVNNPLTHPNLNPNLWLKAGYNGGPDRNHMYGLFNRWMLAIGSEHLNSKVRGNFRPTSSNSDKPSCF